MLPRIDPVGVAMDILVFEVADRRFGLPAKHVQEVGRIPAVAPLPKAPPVVEGVVNVRGVLVPVLDIRLRFGLPARPLSLDQHLLIARTPARAVALRVDRAVELLSVEDGAIEPPTNVVPGIEYVAGIAVLKDGLLVIHDLERFLSLDEAEQVDAAVTGTAPPGPAAARRTGR